MCRESKGEYYISLYGDKCFYCNRKLKPHKITIDHFVPVSKGGRNKNNRVICCNFCNSLKSNHDLYNFRDELLISRKININKGNKNLVKKIERAINKCSLILNNIEQPKLF